MCEKGDGMNTLFIDTHDELINVSMVLKNDIFTKEVISGSHSTHLLPLINNMLKEKKIKLNDFNRVVVVNGPGSFTGIRIGLTVAKTISYSLNIPIYIISSLKAYLVSSNLDNKMCIIEDSKGYYIGTDTFELYTDSLDDYKDYNVVKKSCVLLSAIEFIITFISYLDTLSLGTILFKSFDTLLISSFVFI